MRRVLFILAVLLLAFGAIASTTLPREVRTLLQNALSNEREAIARYDLFAKKAEEEGFRGAAALFRAQAQAERTHAARFTALLQSNGIPLPPEQTFTPRVGTTGENLRAAAAAERSEHDGTYQQAIETCNEHGAQDIAVVFNQTRDSEVEHANLCNAAARDLDSLKEPKTFYVCGKCGFTMDLKLSFCPVCQIRRPPAAIE